MNWPSVGKLFGRNPIRSDERFFVQPVRVLGLTTCPYHTHSPNHRLTHTRSFCTPTPIYIHSYTHPHPHIHSHKHPRIQPHLHPHIRTYIRCTMVCGLIHEDNAHMYTRPYKHKYTRPDTLKHPLMHALPIHPTLDNQSLTRTYVPACGDDRRHPDARTDHHTLT